MTGDQKPALGNPPGKDIHVMVVGSSDYVSAMAARALDGAPGVRVVAKPANLGLAVPRLKRDPVDVMVVDIESQAKELIKALPKILDTDPDIKIVMTAPLSFSTVKTSMQGLLAGAADFIALPPPPRRKLKLRVDPVFQKEIRSLVSALGRARQKESNRQEAKFKPVPVQLRPVATKRPDVIVIGSSTGGPKVLMSIFEHLPKVITQPILVVQHMPAGFTKTLAENISRKSPWQCTEAEDGEEIIAGRIYIAPGGKHMVVEGRGHKKRIRLNEDPPVNYCRPAADPLFASAAKAYDGRVLAAVLTGMGHDGRDGAGVIVEAGGTVIAQDEDSSVVWGMPGSVAEAGHCSAVLPDREIAANIRKIATGKG